MLPFCGHLWSESLAGVKFGRGFLALSSPGSREASSWVSSKESAKVSCLCLAPIRLWQPVLAAELWADKRKSPQLRQNRNQGRQTQREPATVSLPENRAEARAKWQLNQNRIRASEGSQQDQRLSETEKVVLEFQTVYIDWKIVPFENYNHSGLQDPRCRRIMENVLIQREIRKGERF